MKTNQAEAVGRLKALYGKKAENQIFARMGVRLPSEIAERLRRGAAQIPPGTFPAAERIFPLWEAFLAFHDQVEDDWIPSIYPRAYDQGIYGTLFGAPMELNEVAPPGCVSSMTRPLEDKTYAELLQLASSPRDEWLGRMESDLRHFSAQSGGRWGVAVTITIDAFNLCNQIRGFQTMLDIYDCPDELRRFLQAGVDLNIAVVERQRAAIRMECAGGVYDYFNAGWVPERSIPMSVDCYNMCAPEVYEEFGLAYQQQLLDRFGGGNFHVHGNGRHLLPGLARLRGCVVALIANDGSKVDAIDDLEAIKRQAGPVTLVIPCDAAAFTRKLREGSLAGGVYYDVSPLDSVAEANRLMESVRRYRA